MFCFYSLCNVLTLEFQDPFLCMSNQSNRKHRPSTNIHAYVKKSMILEFKNSGKEFRNTYVRTFD